MAIPEADEHHRCEMRGGAEEGDVNLNFFPKAVEVFIEGLVDVPQLASYLLMVS